MYTQLVNFDRYLTAHRLLHTLWTKAVGRRDYVKRDWQALEETLEQIALYGPGSLIPADPP